MPSSPVRALAAQGRWFVKPLRYDAPAATKFANAILLDAGVQPVPLHVLSAFERRNPAKGDGQDIALHSRRAWVWSTNERMPHLPLMDRTGRPTIRVADSRARAKP